MSGRQHPRHRRPNAGSHQMERPLLPRRHVGNGKHVSHVLVYVIGVDTFRSSPCRETTQVRRHNPKPETRKSRDLVMPLPPVPWQPMEHHDQRSVRRASHQRRKLEPTGTDRDLFHRPNRTSALTTPGKPTNPRPGARGCCVGGGTLTVPSGRHPNVVRHEWVSLVHRWRGHYRSQLRREARSNEQRPETRYRSFHCAH